jgi:adenylate cyclase, class 2
VDEPRYIETEVKLLVDNLAEIEAQLESAGASLIAPRTFERNIRYENPEGTFSPNGIVLRLRQDRRARLTYKEPVRQTETAVSQRFEAEVTVDNMETMDLILQKLGFRPYRVYEKYRTTYVYGQTEIVLDEMPYGTFVEVEGPADAIHSVRHDLGWERYQSFQENYLELFDRVKALLHLDFNDLTFANFAGIQVPPEAFGSSGRG